MACWLPAPPLLPVLARIYLDFILVADVALIKPWCLLAPDNDGVFFKYKLFSFSSYYIGLSNVLPKFVLS